MRNLLRARLIEVLVLWVDTCICKGLRDYEMVIDEGSYMSTLFIHIY